ERPKRQRRRENLSNRERIIEFHSFVLGKGGASLGGLVVGGERSGTAALGVHGVQVDRSTRAADCEIRNRGEQLAVNRVRLGRGRGADVDVFVSPEIVFAFLDRSVAFKNAVIREFHGTLAGRGARVAEPEI